MIIIKTRVPGAHIILQINRYLYSVIVHKFFLANKTLKNLFFLLRSLGITVCFSSMIFSGLLEAKWKGDVNDSQRTLQKQGEITNVNKFGINFLNDNAGGRISFKIYIKCFC